MGTTEPSANNSPQESGSDTVVTPPLPLPPWHIGDVAPTSDDVAVAAHTQKETHSYTVKYPAHPARAEDPNYVDFEAIHRQWKADPTKWQCSVGAHRNDFSECSLDQPLELHHSHIEFALQNGVDLKWLEVDYPGVSDQYHVGAWVESAANLEVLCVFHHRGYGGAHVASHSDYVAEEYVRGLIDHGSA